MSTQTALESLVMDLKRVALSYYRGSTETAERFSKEALKRKKEANQEQLKPYIRKLLNNLENILHKDGKMQTAESALMYSTILQNYCTHYFHKDS